MFWFSGCCVCALLPPNGQCGKYKGLYSPPYTRLCHIRTSEKTAEMMGSLRVIEHYILETSALTQNSKCMWASPLKITELIKNCSLILCWNNEIHYLPIEQKSSQMVSFNCREMQMQSNNQGLHNWAFILNMVTILSKASMMNCPRKLAKCTIA